MTANFQPSFPLIWDSSMRGSFVACPRQFYWQYLRQLGPSETSVHLHFGGAFAAGLEAFRKEFYGNSRDFRAAQAAGLRAILSFWGDYEPPADSPKTLENCLLAFDAYLTHWPPDTDYIQPYMPASGVPAVEFRFAIPLEDVPHPETGEPLIYAGRFDMLGLYNSQLWAVDEKTTTRLGPSWTAQWDLRAQFIGYVWAARQFDHQVAGAIVRGTAIKSSGFDFAEVPVTIPEWKINAWREQLSRDLRRAIQCYTEGYWDMNFDSSCTSYSGCSYKRLCDSPEPERWVDTYYVTRHWNPLQLDPTAPKETEDAKLS